MNSSHNSVNKQTWTSVDDLESRFDVVNDYNRQSNGCHTKASNNLLMDFKTPLVENGNYNSESQNCKSNRYFGNYTLFEVCCIISISLSGLSIVILLLVWGPIPPIRFKYWNDSTTGDISNTGSRNPVEGARIMIMSDFSFDNNDTDSIYYNKETIADKRQTGNNDIVLVKTINDFSNIDETTVTLKIESLISTQSLVLPPSNNIQWLELLGPISKEGLELIFTQFKSIQYLYVNVDNSCSSYPITSKLPTIYMHELISVFVQNSEKCKIFDWPIYLQTPKLKKFKAVDTILKLENFIKLTQFLYNSQETLEDIEITRSFICKDCDISDIDYDNVTKITVINRRTQETLSQT